VKPHKQNNQRVVKNDHKSYITSEKGKSLNLPIYLFSWIYFRRKNTF